MPWPDGGGAPDDMGVKPLAASFPYEHSDRLENGVVYKFMSENLSQDTAYHGVASNWVAN